MITTPDMHSVMVTGATGFVGRSVVRELLTRGLTPVCLVRSAQKLHRQHPRVDPQRLISVVGCISDRGALQHAAELSQAAIHLVGIIIARRLSRQSFERVHTCGTKNVVEAVRLARVRRLVHMSALGARPNATSTYHKTKWSAEESVGQSELDFTIFRPSLIHGPSGELMQLIKRFICSPVPPIIPYFGSGRARVQPVFVKDVAYCMVESLFREETIGKIIPLGGPQAYSWIELYNTCRALMPSAKHWKPLVSLPPLLAKTVAALAAPPMSVAELFVPSIGKFRFDAGQVAMAQEDSICDHTIAEKLFGIQMRSFEEELPLYADQIP